MDEVCRVEVTLIPLKEERDVAVEVRPTGPEREVIPLGVYAIPGADSPDEVGSELIGYIPAHSHADVDLILSSGLELELTMESGVLLVRLAAAV